MRAILFALVSVGLTIGIVSSAQTAPVCTKDDESQAEQSIDTLSSWGSVHDSFQRFAHCDDGAIAEGYDDKIVALLVDHWDSVDQLSKLTHADPRFAGFILKHIDSLMSPDQAKTIVENARQHCPSGAGELCASLEKKAQNPDG